MKEHVKYARARNQLYHTAVLWRQLMREHTEMHPTPQYQHLCDVVETVIDTALHAFENGHILEVLVNVYVPEPLPGFEELMKDWNEAVKYDQPLSDDLGDTSNIDDIP